MCFYLDMCLRTCVIIPVKAKTKGQYVSWLSSTTIERQIMISGKLAFFNLRAI